jgi:hypothetical protein
VQLGIVSYSSTAYPLWTRGKELTITVQNPLEQTRIHRLPIPLLLNLLVHRQGQTGLAAGRVNVFKDVLFPCD